MDPTSQWDDGWADDTLRPSPSGNALSDVPPLSSSLAPHSSDVAVSRFANINRTVIDMADPGSHLGRNVAGALQERPSHEEIGRSALSREHNQDTTGASSPATALGQRSREKPRSKNPLRGAETNCPQTAAESSEPDVKLNVRPSDSQTQALIGSDDPQRVISGPVIPTKSFGKSEHRVMQDVPISSSASMQLGIQPRPTATPPASQNIPSVLAAQVAGSDPALGLPRTTSPGKTNRSPLPPQQVDRTASVQPTASSTYSPPPLNQPSVPMSRSPSRAAPVLRKTLTTQAGRPKGTDDLNARPGPVPSETRYRLDDVKGKGIPDDDGRKSSSGTRTTLPQTPGRPAPPTMPSSPPQPASGQPHLDRSYSRMQGNDGTERESKRAAGEPATEMGRESPSTPPTQAGRPKGTDELNPRPLDDGKGKGIPGENGLKNASEIRTILPQTLGRTTPPSVASSPLQSAFVQPRLDRSYSRMRGNDGTERESKRVAGEPTTEKGRERPSTHKDRQTDVEDHSDGAQLRTGHGLDDIPHSKIARASSVKRTYSSSPSQGNDSSALPPPDTGESRRRVRESPDSPPSIKRTETPTAFPRDTLSSTQTQPELRSAPSSNNETAPRAHHRPRRPSVANSQIPDMRSATESSTQEKERETQAQDGHSVSDSKSGQAVGNEITSVDELRKAIRPGLADIVVPPSQHDIQVLKSRPLVPYAQGNLQDHGYFLRDPHRGDTLPPPYQPNTPLTVPANQGRGPSGTNVETQETPHPPATETQHGEPHAQLSALGGVQPGGGLLRRPEAVVIVEPSEGEPRPPGKLGVPIVNERSPSGASTEASNNARDKPIRTQPLPVELQHPLSTAVQQGAGRHAQMRPLGDGQHGGGQLGGGGEPGRDGDGGRRGGSGRDEDGGRGGGGGGGGGGGDPGRGGGGDPGRGGGGGPGRGGGGDSGRGGGPGRGGGGSQLPTPDPEKTTTSWSWLCCCK
ncbi:hypothetical protein BC827DRAFT_1376069 [Russula dissimulans]|nr:hypothetical protein BC827DRAFT_1376069 [Russula dissimulans]